MAQSASVSSLTITPISEQNNRITVIESNKQSAFYYPLTYGDTHSFITVDPSVKQPFNDAKLAQSAAKAAASTADQAKTAVLSAQKALSDANKASNESSFALINAHSAVNAAANRNPIVQSELDNANAVYAKAQTAARDANQAYISATSAHGESLLRETIAKSSAVIANSESEKANKEAIDSFMLKVDGSNKIIEGNNYPEISTYGYVEIDIVLTGTSEFMSQDVTINAVNPAKFKSKKYIVKSMSFELAAPVAGVATPMWNYDIGMPYESGQEKQNLADSHEKGRRVVTIPHDCVEIELIGKVSGDGFDYIVFNGSSSQSLPDAAQRASASEVNLFDDVGGALFAEINTETGNVLSYKFRDGIKVYVPAFGYCRINYAYQATRFKISYDAQDFCYFVMNTQGFSDATNNKDSLKDWFYIISTGKLKSVYRLKRTVEITQINYPKMPISPMATDINRSLTEQSRQEIERTIKDDNSGAELKLNVTQSVTLTDGNGEPWDLTFNE